MNEPLIWLITCYVFCIFAMVCSFYGMVEFSIASLVGVGISNIMLWNADI